MTSLRYSVTAARNGLKQLPTEREAGLQAMYSFPAFFSRSPPRPGMVPGAGDTA